MSFFRNFLSRFWQSAAICSSDIDSIYSASLPHNQPGKIDIINEPQLDKTNKMAVCLAKTQISLGIYPVWSESSLSAWRKLEPLATQWVHSEDSDQTGQMPRLVWVFDECTVILLVLSCRGSNIQHLNALKIRKIWTPNKTDVIILITEQCSFTIAKRCRHNGKQPRPWSDCSWTQTKLLLSDLVVCCLPRKLRIITVDFDKSTLT